MKNNPKVIIVHHEGANNGVGGVNSWHAQKGFPMSELGFNIGYQWYFDKTLGWIPCRKETEEGMHTLGGWNRKSIGICIQGNYDFEEFNLDLELAQKISDIRKRWGDLPVKTHGEMDNRACPGHNLQKFIDEYRKEDNNLELENKKLMERLRILRDRIKQRSC